MSEREREGRRLFGAIKKKIIGLQVKRVLSRLAFDYKIAYSLSFDKVFTKKEIWFNFFCLL